MCAYIKRNTIEYFVLGIMLEIIINNLSIISTHKTLESKSQENRYEGQTIDQNKIKNLNDSLDEIIDKSKSFEDQIESL